MDPNAGLLIVNADDWGGDSSATDAILAAFESGGITSTTGFVHMPDSRPAAEIALRHGIPVGLHLNLTAALIDPDLAPPVRDRQARLVQLLAGGHAHKAWYPRALRLVRREGAPPPATAPGRELAAARWAGCAAEASAARPVDRPAGHPRLVDLHPHRAPGLRRLRHRRAPGPLGHGLGGDHGPPSVAGRARAADLPRLAVRAARPPAGVVRRPRG